MAVGRRERLVTPVFALVMLSTFAYFAAVGIITPTLPRFVRGPLDGRDVEVGLAVGAFALSAVLLRPFIGRLTDRRGRRVMIVAGGSVVGLSIIGYVVAQSLPVLILLRLVTGLGEAAFYVGAASVINDIAPDERRGEAISYFSLALFAGLALGPIAGEWILGLVDFWAVWVAAGAASLFAAAVGLMVPETRPAGVTLEAGPLIHKAALLPGAILGTCVWALASFNSFVPLYALDLGMKGSGYVFALNSAILMTVRLLGARLPDRLGPRRAAAAALVLTSLGLLTMGVWRGPTGLFTGTAIYAFGHALYFPALMTLAVSRAPVSERGSVVGTFTAFFDLSFGVGAASAGVVATYFGYRGAFVVASIVAAGGLALLLTTVARERRERAVRMGAEAASEAA